jgi:hypothetical protein
MQSAFDLQPAAHDVPAQYSPVGQLSFEGRHGTQVFVMVSHHGVAPWHCELARHCTHTPELHSWPVGHGCVEVHPATQAFALHTVPAAQSVLARHATHVSFVGLHLAVGAAQSVSCRHPTHAFVVVSQTVAVGHVLMASQPIAHASFTHRWPAAQSADVRHATHEVCASHFCPVGQSAFVPQTWHAPLTQTWPVVLVAQSLFALQPPALGAPSGLTASVLAPSPPNPVDASSPGTENDGDPELAHPEGNSITAATRDRTTESARKRRSRTMRTI